MYDDSIPEGHIFEGFNDIDFRKVGIDESLIPAFRAVECPEDLYEILDAVKDDGLASKLMQMPINTEINKLLRNYKKPVFIPRLVEIAYHRLVKEDHYRIGQMLLSDPEVFKKNGIDIHKMIGCGMYGCTFETDDKKIVAKITNDISEVELFSIADSEKLRGFVKIYGISNFIDPYFIIFKERVLPIERMRKIPKDSYSYDGILQRYYDNPLKFEQIWIEERDKAPLSFRHIFDSLVDLLYLGYCVSDIGQQNLGVRINGEFVIYDGWIDELPPS